MLSIWKFPLEITDAQTIKMPAGAELLSVGEQNGTLCLWAKVDPNKEIVEKNIRIFGTVHPVPKDDFENDKELSFIGTVQIGSFVWHVFK